VNKAKMMAMVRKKSQESGISINTLLLLFFFEQFLNRIADSEYKNCFVLKGGFLLSSLMGIESRTTVDMDMSLRNLNLSEQVIEQVICQIAAIDLNDNITFEYKGASEIKAMDDYPGLRVSLVGHMENIRQPFSIDIATGDPITPGAVKYQYASVFDKNAHTEIFAYNVETIIAEKLETISSKKLENGRSKDFYDLFLIFSLDKKEINREKLTAAVDNTFKHRGTDSNANEIIKTLELIRGDESFRDRWSRYCKKNPYVHDCTLDQVINTIENGVRTYLVTADNI
jgi:predicted nucleotidyltransferase component of viral defense system